MISVKPVVVVAVLALAGISAAQDETREQRIEASITQLADEAHREEAILELVNIGEPAADKLVLALRRNEHQIRIGALEALGRMGPHGTGAVPSLLRALDSLPREELANGLEALAGIAPWGKEYRPELEELADYHADVGLFATLRSLPPHLRGPVLAALERLEARTQIPDELPTAELIFILDRKHRLFEDSGRRSHPDLWIETAAEVLGWREQEAQRALWSLGLAYERYRMDASTHATLMRDQPDSATTMARIAERIGDAILKIGPEDRRAIPVYEDRLMQGGLSTRKEYALVLGHFGSAAAPAVPGLIECLEWGSEALHAEAITALGMIGPAAKDAIPVLEMLAEHEDSQIAERAKAALRQVRGRPGAWAEST